MNWRRNGFEANKLFVIQLDINFQSSKNVDFAKRKTVKKKGFEPSKSTTQFTHDALSGYDFIVIVIFTRDY